MLERWNRKFYESETHQGNVGVNSTTWSQKKKGESERSEKNKTDQINRTHKNKRINQDKDM